jgi:acetyltransferase
LDAGATSITVISAGFKEVGKEGAALEKEIVELVRSRGARMLGPNCLGHINTHAQLNASFSKKVPHPGAISVVSQSGALMCAILDWAVERKVGMSKIFSIGNKGDLCENDFFEALANDDKTNVVLTYLDPSRTAEVHQGRDRLRQEEAHRRPEIRHLGRRPEGHQFPHRLPGGRR